MEFRAQRFRGEIEIRIGEPSHSPNRRWWPCYAGRYTKYAMRTA